MSAFHLQERLLEIQQRIVNAGGKNVEIIAATKSQTTETLLALNEAGVSHFAESYTQEFIEKQSSPELQNLSIQWHFVGQLQSNKVRQLNQCEVFLFQSVDRKNLICEIGKHFPGSDVLIQIDTTGNPNRGGAQPDDVERLTQLAIENFLNPKGIMLIARVGVQESIEDFKLARQIQEKMKFSVLSAGMSEDFELAVAEGATMVRLGRALFSI